jgi:RimJ/RimL family protein N-acetyltransferase
MMSDDRGPGEVQDAPMPGADLATPAADSGPAVTIRPSTADDFDAWFALYDAVAAEGIWIAGESPSDRVGRRRTFERNLDSDTAITWLAMSGDDLVGMLGMTIEGGRASFGMLVDAARRGGGIGSGLLAAGIEWATAHGAHKISLEVWPHNARARALYLRYGFVEEGRLRRHYRRRNGELWDSVMMGLVRDEAAPGSPHPG